LRILAVAILVVLCVGRVAAADTISVEKSQRLDATLEDARRRAGIPGLAVGIVESGMPAYARGFGVRDLQTGAPVTADTQFHVASISKTFTATAVMQLIEQRKLALTDPVERVLPAFAGSGITVEQLLTHTAGLADWIHPSGATRDAQVAEYVIRVARHSPAYLPGKGWKYSDADFNVLGAMVESISGQPFPDYLERHVFAVTGMTQSTARPPDAAANIAWPHRGGKSVRRASRHPWDRVFVPSSGIQSSANDLTRWAAANLNRDPALLSPASYAALFERRVDTEWPGVAMGLGWQLEQRGDTWLPRHPGGEAGFRSLLTIFPEQQRAIVILSNGEATPRWEIRDAIETILSP
jgi:CubicO group peptidase (beta-lactamase class C family)